LQQLQFESPKVVADNRDESIQNMRETIEILELKVKKLEHMMKIKENKIETLTKRLADAGLY
jgi:chaperonin cofactor prefoldin